VPEEILLGGSGSEKTFPEKKPARTFEDGRRDMVLTRKKKILTSQGCLAKRERRLRGCFQAEFKKKGT